MIPSSYLLYNCYTWDKPQKCKVNLGEARMDYVHIIILKLINKPVTDISYAWGRFEYRTLYQYHSNETENTPMSLL